MVGLRTMGYTHLRYVAFWLGCIAILGPASNPLDMCLAAEIEGLFTRENAHVKWTLDRMARTVEFIDRATGTNYAAAQVPICILRMGAREFAPTSAEWAGDMMALSFNDIGAKLRLEIRCEPEYFVVKLVEYQGPPPAWAHLIHMRLRLGQERNWTSGLVSDGQFAVCVRVADYRLGFTLSGGSESTVAVTVYPHRLWQGAWATIVAAPKGEIRKALQEAVTREKMLASPVGGPFAWDSLATRGSYVFAYVTEANVDEWIKLCQRGGIDLIHMIGWDSSQGYYQPRKDAFPRGLESLRDTVEKIHAAGLRVGLHYLFGISPNDPYIRPKPDGRLKIDAQFELAAPVDEKADFLPTTVAPKDLPTVWAYMSRGNVVRIGDELIQYHALSTDPPGFAQCRRGVFGTTPSAHEAGAKVDKLYAIYGLFYPDEQSDLIEEIAEKIAEVVNACKIDLVYMDGAEGVPGGWYGVSRMRAEVFRRFRHPVMVEASEWGYHSWTFHSRTGAWDHPNWGLKRFVDIHVAANRAYQSTSLLPTQLGWWAILSDSRDHYCELPDELEYLCVKSLAWDMPMSFQGLTVGEAANARQDEYLDMLGRYERLRLGRAIPEGILEQLRREGREFRLAWQGDDSWHFVPCEWLWHRAEFTQGQPFVWEFDNPHAAQPLKFRLRILEVAAPPDGPGAVTVSDFQNIQIPVQAAPGITATVIPVSVNEGPVGVAARFTARNNNPGRQGAWARAAIRFPKHLDLSKTGALAVWIHGDGKGELLNFQPRNPEYHWPTLAEHYVDVNFEGWKLCELHFKERDAHRHGEFVWPYSDYYAIYRNPLIRHDVDGLTIYFNNLPPDDEVTCLIGPVVAVPTEKIRVDNLAIRVGDQAVEMPVILESGHYLECLDGGKVRHFDARGRLIGEVELATPLPTVTSGKNRLELKCRPQDETVGGGSAKKVRCEVWVLVEGPPLVAGPQ